ncbi:MAG: acyl transferase [Sphingobacteriia bacterium]|nr:MAG: acyl transferase [Sphingobacteriia bacterium]TAG30946.1 MAG: acyl transferase [Sphingobacteriia bacterium]TAH08806.1 MAG: acyl transferase [Sphingobacteriia bacterium]
MSSFDINKIFSVSASSFDEVSKAVFQYQYQYNPVYKQWVDLVSSQARMEKIPYSMPMLPISFFKTHEIYTGGAKVNKVFESSGTTDVITSRHCIADLQLYERSFVEGFERVYGSIKGWCILALLPAYLEKENSSLVYMADCLIRRTAHSRSNFYLYNYSELAAALSVLEDQGQKTLLLGVSFALLDFVNEFPQQLKHTIVMETGGMKGRGREMTRAELHHTLGVGLGVNVLHGEYGMTELLSQAYSLGGGRYTCPPWMRVMVAKEDDPKEILSEGVGILQIIDLANIYSCSFIATQDIGRVYADGSFEVLGRMDQSDMRGCSLLVV